MTRKTTSTNHPSESTHQVATKPRLRKALQKKRFQSDIIFRHYVKMPPAKPRERPTKPTTSTSPPEKLRCQNPTTTIKVINMTRNSSKSNKPRNTNTTGRRTRNTTTQKRKVHNIKIKIILGLFCFVKYI